MQSYFALYFGPDSLTFVLLLPNSYHRYSKVPKFSDTRKLCCNLPKIKEKRPNLQVFRQKDANGIANSGDPDQSSLI